MPDWNSYLLSLALLLGLAVLAWLVSLAKRDVGIVDSLWSLMILAVVLVTLWLHPAAGWRAWLVVVLASIWALRLSIYIALRNRGRPEDRRYQAIRRNNEPYFSLKSLYIVFGLQAVLAWIVALPLHAAVITSTSLTWLDMAGVVLWFTGFGFEAVADAQLALFKKEPGNKDSVMNRGLWRYSRHPNYFGECCLWWGFYCFALAAGAWWAVISPLLMTVLLLKVSGVTMLEKDITDRRPGYRDYMKRTNAFIPGPPGKSIPIPSTEQLGR